MTMDTTTNYMGLELAHPIVPSASPLTGSMETLRTLEAHGAPAVVLPSLFEEQIDHESHQFASLFGVGGGGFAESTEGYFPEMDDYNTGPESYLGLVSVAKNVLPSFRKSSAKTSKWCSHRTDYNCLFHDIPYPYLLFIEITAKGCFISSTNKYRWLHQTKPTKRSVA